MPELLGQLEQSLGASYRLVRELGGGAKRRLAALAAETS
jgi:hypothetical protein